MDPDSSKCQQQRCALALDESSTLLDSHTMQSQKSVSYILILQYATFAPPAIICPASY